MTSELLNPDIPEEAMRLHMGELTASELRVARAAIRWANTHSITQWLDGLDVGKIARFIWDEEHEGRNNQVLNIEWVLLKADYCRKAQAIISHLKTLAAGKEG